MAIRSLHTTISGLYDNKLSIDELQEACDNLMGFIQVLYEEDERQNQLKEKETK